MAASPERTGAFIARTVGVSRPSVSAWLAGYSRPKGHLRDLISQLAGIPVEAWTTAAEREHEEQARKRVDAASPSTSAA